MLRRFFCGLVSLSFVVSPAFGQARSEPPSPRLLLEKNTLSLNSQLSQVLQSNYNNLFAPSMTTFEILPRAIYDKTYSTLIQKIPDLQGLDRKRLDGFVLRTAVAFRLMKNGFEGAAEKELIYMAGDLGEIADFIRLTAKDEKLAEIQIEDVVLTVNRLQVENLPRLTEPEKMRVLSLWERAGQSWSSEESLETAMKEVRSKRLFSARALFLAEGVLVILASYYAEYMIGDQLNFYQNALAYSAFWALETAIFVTYRAELKSLRRPWEYASFNSARIACAKTLANLKGIPFL